MGWGIGKALVKSVAVAVGAVVGVALGFQALSLIDEVVEAIQERIVADAVASDDVLNASTGGLYSVPRRK